MSRSSIFVLTKWMIPDNQRATTARKKHNLLSICFWRCEDSKNEKTDYSIVDINFPSK